MAREAATHAANPTLELYRVAIDGQSTWAEVLYLGDRDVAGVAWGADATWLEMVISAEDACHRAFDDIS